MFWKRALWTLALVALVVGTTPGCSSDGGVDTAPDALVDAADASPDVTTDADAPEVDAGPEPLPVLGAIATPLDGSVLPDGLEGCATIRETACVGGTVRRCEVYDGAAEAWVPEEDVPPMTLQAFVFDRYLDLYHEFDGQTVDVDFAQPVPQGTPEEEWSMPEYLHKMNAYGDSSGWTGTALFAAAGRYRSTGTEADYERMLRKLENTMFFYEMTDIPGMMGRSHWAMMPEGTPVPHGHWGKALAKWYPETGDGWHYHYPISEAHHDRLPDYYLEGIEVDGEVVPTQARWQGDASRDMYVRSMPGVLMAWDLLREGPREDAVREVVRSEIPCTLNRLKKARIRNLQDAPEVLEGVTTFLAGQELTLDEGDVDFGSLDELVVYVMEQPNPAHMDLFDPSCPDGPPMEVDPELDMDATADDFLLQLLVFGQRMQKEHQRPIVWPMIASVRASDLLFMTQWALVSHYLTGDEAYLAFLEQLMDETAYEGVLMTYGAYGLPKWCQSHYAPSLAYPSLYNLLARVDPGRTPEFWELLSRVAVEEGRHKEMAGRDDCYWGVLYHRMATPYTDPDRDPYVQHHVEVLKGYGMNPDDKLDPDRNVPRDWTDPPHPDIELEEVTEEERAICEAPVEVLGIEIESPGMNDEHPRAVDALPLDMRIGAGFLWTADPWLPVRGGGLTTQYPMLGMTTPYWVGRSDGVITEGEGLALAWRDTGEACGE